MYINNSYTTNKKILANIFLFKLSSLVTFNKCCFPNTSISNKHQLKFTKYIVTKFKDNGIKCWISSLCSKFIKKKTHRIINITSKIYFVHNGCTQNANTDLGKKKFYLMLFFEDITLLLDESDELLISGIRDGAK